MDLEKFKNALVIVSGRLNQSGIKYALVGSLNQVLQGMNLSPKDLDLVARIEDLAGINSLFHDYSPSQIKEMKPDSTDPKWTAKLERHPASGFHFNVGDAPIHILGERDDGDYVSKLLEGRLSYLEIENVKVPCFTLEAEADAYKDTFRPDKSARIREFMMGRK